MSLVARNILKQAALRNAAAAFNANIQVVWASRRYASDSGSSSHNSTSSSILSTTNGLGSYEEPEYAVTDDEDFNPAHVKIAYLPDNIRIEMYNLHKSDMEKWDEVALSRKYAASITRVRAVLLLMQRREELRNRLLGTTDGSVPAHWKVVYARYCEDKEANTPEALFQEFCATNKPKPAAKKTEGDAEAATVESADSETESVAEKTEVVAASSSAPSASFAAHFPTPASIQDMIARYEEHLTRTADQECFDDSMEQQLEVLRGHGVDTTFKELREGRDLNSITGYSPRLIGDDLNEYKKEMQRIKAKILSQTAAVPAKNSDDVDKELLTFDDKLKYAPADVENRAQVKFDHSSRWKFAYKDISELQSKTQPTMIRTRTGKLRPATPLEELGRSWYGKKPSYMDRQLLYNQKFNTYADPDQDETILTTFYQEKKKRNADLAEKMGGSAK